MKLKHDIFRVYTRKAELTKILSSFLLLVCAFGILFYLVREKFIIRPALLSEGLETIAYYVDRQSSSRDDGTSYSLTYNYTVDELTYSRKHSTNGAIYWDTEIGDTVYIRYLPDAPHISRTVDETNQPATILDVAIIVVSLGVVIFQLFSLLLKIAFHLRGQPLDGEIMSISGAWEERSNGPGGSKSIFVIKVHYQFTEPHTGKLISNKVRSERNDLEEKLQSEISTRIVILYLNKYFYRVL